VPFVLFLPIDPIGPVGVHIPANPWFLMVSFFLNLAAFAVTWMMYHLLASLLSSILTTLTLIDRIPSRMDIYIWHNFWTTTSYVDNK
jgi:hypothetical protein